MTIRHALTSGGSSFKEFIGGGRDRDANPRMVGGPEEDFLGDNWNR